MWRRWLSEPIYFRSRIELHGRRGAPICYLTKSGDGEVMDILTPKRRSELMGRIRSRDTRPELVVRSLLDRLGYRFRVHALELPGTPDIVFRSRRVALFVHGCFWHRHGCRLTYTPKTRREFWQGKFRGNVRRDRAVRKELEARNWRILVVWECQLSRPAALARRLIKLLGPPSRTTSEASLRRLIVESTAES